MLAALRLNKGITACHWLWHIRNYTQSLCQTIATWLQTQKTVHKRHCFRMPKLMHGKCRRWYQKPQQNAEDTATHSLETEFSMKFGALPTLMKRNMMARQQNACS